MNKIIVKGLAVAALFAFPVTNAQAICLDYWIKGPAACKEDPKDKNRILIKGGKNIEFNVEKDQARVEYEKDLNLKIDKFLAGYGKPPREFAAFHLDPTLENAVRWVKKFNEEYERTMKVAVAWKQADQLFRQYKATGELLLPAESGVKPEQIKYLKEAFEADATDLPKVKGFGVNLPGDWDEDRLSRDYAKLDYKEKTLAKLTQEAANPMPLPPAFGTTALMKQIDKTSIKPKFVKELEEKTGTTFSPTAEQESKNLLNKLMPSTKMTKTSKLKKDAVKENLEISYYFSAKCPFCTQFKPELKQAIAEYGKDKVKVTCVDMTPGERTPNNVKGKLDCKWRPILAGEMKQFGIQKTPSIIVKRGSSNQLELLENYHDSDVLVKYFKHGPKMAK